MEDVPVVTGKQLNSLPLSVGFSSFVLISMNPMSVNSNNQFLVLFVFVIIVDGKYSANLTYY